MTTKYRGPPRRVGRVGSSLTPAISQSGTNTAISGNNYAGQSRFVASNFPGGSSTVYFQDWYMLDTTGAAPFNTYLGNVRVLMDVPTADSATGGLNTWAFTTPQGTDYGNCANIPPNTSDYNSSATVGARMSFRFPALNAVQCLGLNTWFSVEEDSAGTRSVTAVYRNGTSDQVGGNPVALASPYAYFNQISVTDPATSIAWANEPATAAGGCEIGLQVTA